MAVYHTSPANRSTSFKSTKTNDLGGTSCKIGELGSALCLNASYLAGWFWPAQVY
jgi:hypothetical protein